MRGIGRFFLINFLDSGLLEYIYCGLLDGGKVPVRESIKIRVKLHLAYC